MKRLALPTAALAVAWLVILVGTIISGAMGLAIVSLLDKLFSILTFLTLASLLVALLVVLPLAVPKPTRAFSSATLGIISYLFGATVWVESVLAAGTRQAILEFDFPGRLRAEGVGASG